MVNETLSACSDIPISVVGIFLIFQIMNCLVKMEQDETFHVTFRGICAFEIVLKSGHLILHSLCQLFILYLFII